jgi:hypothetical protein
MRAPDDGASSRPGVALLLSVVVAVVGCAPRATGLPPGPPPEYERPPLAPWDGGAAHATNPQENAAPTDRREAPPARTSLADGGGPVSHGDGLR